MVDGSGQPRQLQLLGHRRAGVKPADRRLTIPLHGLDSRVDDVSCHQVIHSAALGSELIAVVEKIRSLGLKMALSDKALGGKLVVLDTLELKDAKTKALAGKLGKLDLGNRALFIDGDAVHASFAMASANLIGIDAMPAAGANVYDIIRADTLVLTRAAVEKLEARFNG